MNDYWNGRFRAEGRIWGDRPSKTVEQALEAFRGCGARRVLIPGAGYGRNAEVFATAGFDVTAVEISSEALALAPEKSRVKYCHGSMLEGAFPGDPFDALYCYNVLHLFLKIDRSVLIERCRLALKPGGLAFFTVFSDAETQYGKGGMVEENTFESRPGRPVHFFTDQDLRDSLSGFQVIETGSAADPENHGNEGPHVHALRYVLARRNE